MGSDSQEHQETYKAGERILTKGAPAHKTYMIMSGEVRVFDDNDGRVIDLATLGAGEIFGETALFHDSVYGANVEAVSDVTLSIITPGWLDGAMEHADPMVAALVKMLIERLRATNDALVKSETRGFIEIGFV